jgi:electron transfer flavoprotein beta subunit
MTALKQSEITVLVSVRIDPVSGRATRSVADAATVALAQKVLGPGGEPTLCTAGPMPPDVAREYLALGVSKLTQLSIHRDAAAQGIVSALANACCDDALVLMGPRGESGLGSGMLPYALAQRLGRPLLNEVIDLAREGDGGWRVVQALPRGARRLWRLEPGAPAVLVTSPRLAQREDLPLRYSWVAAQQGTVTESAAAAAVPSTSKNPEWKLEPARKQRRPLTPVSVESGAARMARATGSGDSSNQAGVVIREGSVADKAQMLLDHLRKLALVTSSE